MDQHKLRTLVFEKTGVRIDIDDPVFALVALNEAVLAEAVERHVALLDDATQALAEQAQALQLGGGAPARRDAAPAPPPMPVAPLQSERRIMAVAGAAAVLGALLVLLGQAIFFRPPPPVIQGRELSAEQSAALKNFDKLSRIVQKLDQKTRNAIEAEMQKP